MAPEDAPTDKHPALAAFCLIFGFLYAPLPIHADSTAISTSYRNGQILVRPASVSSANTLNAFTAALGAKVAGEFPSLGGLQIVTVPAGENVTSLIARYTTSGLVDYAEPDYIRHLNVLPNDPKFGDGTLWGLNNYGQGGGTVDADIDAPEGWDFQTSASNVVVAVLDSGARLTHEDLAPNLWTNPADGSHGWNALLGTNDPSDDNGHGSLTSGVLGAVGNNGKGVVGVAWSVRMMQCKCFDVNNNGSDSAILACLEYARTNGARIINASWGGFGFSLSLSNAIALARDQGILFVAACGNNAANIDVTPYYPASYNLENIVSVGYTTRTDALGQYSNYGATNVDLAAPGAAMYSTFFVGDNSYLGGSFLEGTSLAAPYVAGAMALLVATYPAETNAQLIPRLLAAADPVPGLAGRCRTSGRLNLRQTLSPLLRMWALPPTSPAGPARLHLAGGPDWVCVIEASTNLLNWAPIYTNSTGVSCTIDFVDPDSLAMPTRMYRARSSH